MDGMVAYHNPRVNRPHDRQQGDKVGPTVEGDDPEVRQLRDRHRTHNRPREVAIPGADREPPARIPEARRATGAGSLDHTGRGG